MNCESSRKLPTGKCEVISGKSVGCGRPAWRKGFSSPGVMKPGTSGLESVLPAQRNVLNERGRFEFICSREKKKAEAEGTNCHAKTMLSLEKPIKLI
jgi:hypothetical protein